MSWLEQLDAASYENELGTVLPLRQMPQSQLKPWHRLNSNGAPAGDQPTVERGGSEPDAGFGGPVLGKMPQIDPGPVSRWQWEQVSSLVDRASSCNNRPLWWTKRTTGVRSRRQSERMGVGNSESVGSTSSSLLLRVKAHDDEAWRRLVRLYGPLVFYWCAESSLQEVDRADVFQEVFQSLAANIGNFRRDRPGDTFRGWLRTIVRNKVRDHFRKAKGEPVAKGGSDAHRWLQEIPETEFRDAAPSPETDETTQLYRRALELVRTEFEDRTWQAFWRTAIDQQRPKDVAAELQMSVDAVRQAKSRVLRRLRNEFGDLID